MWNAIIIYRVESVGAGVHLSLINVKSLRMKNENACSNNVHENRGSLSISTNCRIIDTIRGFFCVEKGKKLIPEKFNWLFIKKKWVSSASFQL